MFTKLAYFLRGRSASTHSSTSIRRSTIGSICRVTHITCLSASSKIKKPKAWLVATFLLAFIVITVSEILFKRNFTYQTKYHMNYCIFNVTIKSVRVGKAPT